MISAEFITLGDGGQYIYVVPDLSLAAVITNNNKEANYKNHTLVGDYIIPEFVNK